MNKRPGALLATAWLLLMTGVVKAQAPTFFLNSRSEHIVERWELKRGKHLQGISTHLKPFSRERVTTNESWQTFWDSLPAPRSAVDRYQLRQLAGLNRPYMARIGDNNNLPGRQGGILGAFYESRRHLFSYEQHAADGSGFSLYANPVLGLNLHRSQEGEGLLYRNTRGVRLRGDVDQKLGFQFYLSENQATFPQYIDAYASDYGVIPNQGFIKRDGETFDFFNASGSVTFEASQHIHLQFGHGDHFIGEGHRSLLKSDFGPNYLYLRGRAQFGPIDYQSIFTQFTGEDISDPPYEQKYGAFHHLSIDITPSLELGLFESVIFSRSGNRGFRVQYLNPVIFYRYVDHQLGSPDNLLVGMNVDYMPFRRFQVYGQFVLDEFKISEIRAGDGWWGNKFGWQLGTRYVDALGVNQLDIGLEYNQARPYLYSQRNRDSYTHFNQPIAHPLGANFRELILSTRYQPFKRWRFRLLGGLARYGADTNGTNWGRNPRLSYTTREDDYGNTTGQGAEARRQWLQFTLGYEPYPNLMLQLRGRYREQLSDYEALEQSSLYFGAGLQYHFHQKASLF